VTEAGATAGAIADATAGAGSNFTAIAGEDDLWDGEMESYDLDGREILLVRLDGEYHAYDGTCPHKSTALITGTLEGNLLTCGAHEWEFDARTGQGVNPTREPSAPSSASRHWKSRCRPSRAGCGRGSTSTSGPTTSDPPPGEGR
jgi:nitrite reductase/ring-hydroxylating ferredoxin subunit